MNGTAKTVRRGLTKEDWLRTGLELLADSDGVAPKVRQVAAELGVPVIPTIAVIAPG